MSVVETLLSNPVVASALAALFLVLIYVLRGVPLWLARSRALSAAALAVAPPAVRSIRPAAAP